MKKTLGLLVLSSLLLIGCGTQQQTENSGEKTEEVVIKAGYISYEPGFIVDPNTKEKSGIFHDILEEIAKRNNFTINYTEEVTRGTLVEVLNSDRVNIIANPVRATPERIENADFSDVVYYSPVGAYVRANDEKLSSTDDINNSDVRIISQDGEAGSVIAKEQFPQAQLILLPQNVDISQTFLEVASNKADVTFAEPVFAYQYINKNNNNLKNVAEKEPVKKRINAYMMKKGNNKLKNTINKTLQEMKDDGTIENIVKKYEPFPGAIMLDK